MVGRHSACQCLFQRPVNELPGLVGQAVSPASPRWTMASFPGRTPAQPQPGFSLYTQWSALFDSNDAGNDPRTRPAKTAARSVPVSGLRFWPSILSTISSAQGPGPDGESTNARGSALLPTRKGDRNASRSLRPEWRGRPSRQSEGRKATGVPRHADPGHDPEPRKRGREWGRWWNPPWPVAIPITAR